MNSPLHRPVSPSGKRLQMDVKEIASSNTRRTQLNCRVGKRRQLARKNGMAAQSNHKQHYNKTFFEPES